MAHLQPYSGGDTRLTPVKRRAQGPYGEGIPTEPLPEIQGAPAPSKLQQFRGQYPQYESKSDEELLDALYTKSYSDKLSVEEFTEKMTTAPYDPTEVTRGPFFTPAVGRKSTETIAKETGIGVQGAPSGAAEFMGYAPYGQEKTAVENFFKKQGMLAEVRTGPQTQALEYSVDKGKTWNLVSKPGADLEDVQRYYPEAKKFAAEVVGGFAGVPIGGTAGAGVGGFAGGPAGAVVGAARGMVAGGVAGATIGNYIGELDRLMEGKEMGAHDLSLAEMNDIAFKEARWTAAFDTTALAALKLYKLYKTRKLGVLPEGISLDDVDTAITNQEELAKTVKEATGVDYNPTLAQSLETTHPMKATLLETEQRLAGELPMGGVATNLNKQQEAIAQLHTRQEGTFGLAEGAPSAQKTAEDIQTLAKGRTEAVKQRFEETADQAMELAGKVADDLNQGAVNYINIGDTVQLSLQTGRDATQTAMRGRYQQFASEVEAAGVTLNLAPLRKTALDLQKQINKDIIPSLAEEDAKVLRNILDTKKQGSVILDASGNAIPPSVGMEQVQRAMSAIRSEIRNIKKGVTPGKDLKSYNQLLSALKKVRREALKDRPDLRDKLATLENDYRKTKNAVDNSLVGDLISKKPNGTYRISGDKLVNKIVNNPAGAKQVIAALDNPDLAFSAGIADDVRAGFLDKYITEATDSATGRVTAAGHKRFMEKRGVSDSMKQFFTPAEMKRFSNARDAAKFAESFTQKRRKLTRLLSKTFHTKIQDIESGAFVDNIFKEGRIEDVKRLKGLLKKHNYKLWQDFQKRAHFKLKNDLGSWDVSGQYFRVSPEKLGKALSNPDFTALADETFGKQYVKDLTAINKVYQSVSTPGGNPIELALREATSRSGIGVSAARSTVAPPLTRKGRMLTGLLQFLSGRAPGKLDAILSDPKELRNLMKTKNLSKGEIRSLIAGSALLKDVEHIFEREE